MNWLWIVGTALSGGLLAAVAVCLGVFLTFSAFYWRKDKEERDQALGWIFIGAIHIAFVLGLPLGTLIGAFWAWRHPELASYAAMPFALLGSLFAIPLTRLRVEEWWADRITPSELKTPRSRQERIRDAFTVTSLIHSVPPVLALTLTIIGSSLGGGVYALPPIAFWLLVWFCRRQARRRTAEKLQAAEVTRYPLSDGSTLVVQSIEIQDYPAAWTDPVGEGAHNAGLTFVSRVDGALYHPGGTLWITWRLENSNDQYPSLVAYLCDVDAPGTGVACPTSGLSMDSAGRKEGMWDFQTFPRRASTFLCRVGQDGWSPWKDAGSFTFPNPKGKELPHWHPEPLPVSRSVEELEITLVGIVTTTPPAGLTSPGFEGRAVTQLVLDLRCDGRSTTDWAPTQISVWDATGNHFSNWKPPHEWKEGLLCASFDASHGVPDDVWKVRIEFKKRFKELLGPDERFVFSDLPLPHHGETVTLDREAVAGGWRVRVPAALGIGARIPDDFVVEKRRTVTDSPVLLVECERIAGDPHRVSPRWEFSNGRGWRERSLSGWGIGGSLDRSLYAMRCPADTDTLVLSASVRKTLCVEFLVELPAMGSGRE